MNELLVFVKAHELIIVMVAYWFFSAAVSALPMPKNADSFYGWFFAFGHTLAGSVSRVMAMRYPATAAKVDEALEPPAKKAV